MTWILAGIALAFAIAYLFLKPDRNATVRAIVKTVPVSLFAVIALLADAPLMLVAGLALGALGDLLLAVADGSGETDAPDRFFVAGLTAFLASHIAYVALFAATDMNEPGWMVLPIGLAMGAIAVFVGRILWRHAGALRVPVAAYVVTILAMGLAALQTGSATLIAGASLFMASDTILGTDRFVLVSGDPRRRWSGPAIWCFYIGAQALILMAFL